ncbi:DMT family transporter [Paenibacillus sp. WLX2291]|uniref:DMT family transporter n=1 Tax=Paenibacillus sp. WLX2291 TaxID=3296934 RepID=UPI0039843EB0
MKQHSTHAVSHPASSGHGEPVHSIQHQASSDIATDLSSQDQYKHQFIDENGRSSKREESRLSGNEHKGLSRKTTLLLVLFLVSIWGINWPLTKMVLPDVPPLLFSGLRTMIGGILLLVLALRNRSTLQWKRNWHIYAVLGIFNIIGYYGLQTIGIGYLPAGLFSTIVFLQPVLLGLFSWMWLGERMYMLKAIGLLCGFAGVAVISSGGLEGELSPFGIIMAIASALSWAIASALSWAIGTIYMKKQSNRIDSLWALTMQLLIGGVVLLALGTGTESWQEIHWTAQFTSILLFISVFVIAGGWLVYFKLLNSGEASTVGSYTFAIPVLSNVFSIFLLGEMVTMTLFAGLLLIAAGIGLVNRKPRVQVELEDLHQQGTSDVLSMRSECKQG